MQREQHKISRKNTKKSGKHDIAKGIQQFFSNRPQKNGDLWIVWQNFKIILLRKLSELQEKTYSQLKEIRKIIHEQNEKSNRETVIIIKDWKKNSGAEEYDE